MGTAPPVPKVAVSGMVACVVIVPGTMSERGTAVGFVAARDQDTEDAVPGTPVSTAETAADEPEPAAGALEAGAAPLATELACEATEEANGVDETDEEAAETATGPRAAARRAYLRILGAEVKTGRVARDVGSAGAGDDEGRDKGRDRRRKRRRGQRGGFIPRLQLNTPGAKRASGGRPSRVLAPSRPSPRLHRNTSLSPPT